MSHAENLIEAPKRGRPRGRETLQYDGREYLNTNRLAEETGYSTHHIRHLARNNQVPSVKSGRQWFINLDDFNSCHFEVRSGNGAPITDDLATDAATFEDDDLLDEL